MEVVLQCGWDGGMGMVLVIVCFNGALAVGEIDGCYLEKEDKVACGVA